MIRPQYKIEVVFNIVLFLFFFSPFISLLIFNITSSKLLTALPALIRDLSILMLVLLAITARLLINKKLNFFSGYFSLILVAIIFSVVIVIFDLGGVVDLEDSVSVLLNNIRRFIFPFLISILFIYYLKVKNIQTCYKYAVIFWCFGFFEYLMPLKFWELMGLLNYWNEYSNSAVSTGDFQENLEGYHRFFTFDTYYIFGFKARRMISFYLEPTTTAALAEASVILALLLKRRTLFYLAVIGGMLTFSKGFVIFLLGLLPLTVINRYMGRRISRLYLFTVFTALFGFIVIFYFFYLNNPSIIRFGFLAHLEGLYEFFIHFELQGYGIGNVGSFRFENMWAGKLSRVGVESALANLISQLGLFGLLPLFLMACHFLIKCNGGKNKYYVHYLFLMYLFIFATSNSATGYSGNFLIFFVMIMWYKFHSFKILSN